MDALGNLARFLLLPGHAHDMKGVAPLIKGVSFDALPADKTCDADWLLQDLDGRGATAAIRPEANRKSSEIMTRRSANGGIWWRIISRK
ncbi:MAG: hypothetical protein Q4P24_10075 [Rhodobacterales bacterium]|nr:hypothetical protein [Rhodobacterales bacterium]